MHRSLRLTNLIFKFPKRNELGISVLSRCLAQTAAKEVTQEQTEKETTSFVMNLFQGKIRTEQIFPFPEVLTPEQHETLHMLIGPASKFFGEISDPLKHDAAETVDEATMEGMRQLGVFGLMVPEKYGGIGLNNTQYGRAIEIMGRNDMGVGILLGAHQSIGYKGILLFGNEAQKSKYLEDLAAGRKLAAYCLTEPGSGSDAGSIKTRAVLSGDGKHYVLNGSKIWISNGGIADVFTVFCKTPIKTPTGDVDKMIALVVERSFGGVTNGPPEKKMGIKASNTAEVFFDDVKVPVENRLGEVGDGFKIAMHILNNGRFGMGAGLSGTMKSAIEKAIEHANNRAQFGSKIATYGSIQEKLTRMAMAQYVTETMSYVVAANMDRGYQDYQLEAAISKIYSSEAAWFVVDEAIQIMGGMGYMRQAGLEKVLRDMRIFRIFEGTSEILRLFVGLTGLQHAGGHLKELQKALKSPTANLGMIFDEGAKRVKRAVGLSSGPTISEYIHPNLSSSAALVSKCVDSFGSAVEQVLIKHGKNVVHEQFSINRLSNSAIDIYAMVVVLSRATAALNKQLPSAAHEQTMAALICAEYADRVEQHLETLRSGERMKRLQTIGALAKDIFQNGQVIPKHPVGY